MKNWNVPQVIDLQRQETAVYPVYGRASLGDAQAHTWAVTVQDNGVPVDLSGASVVVTAVNSQGQTIPVSGTIVGNVATAVLSAECYVLVGLVRCTMRLVAAGRTITTAYLEIDVTRADTTTVIDPDDVVPNLAELIAAVPAANAAASAANAAAKYAARFMINGIFGTIEELRAAHPTGERGDAYAVGNAENNDIYVWSDDTADWENIGSIPVDVVSVERVVRMNPNPMKFRYLFEFAYTDAARTLIQGMCVTDAYIVIAAIDPNNQFTANTLLYVYDKTTYAFVKTVDAACYQHANSLTYNSRTGHVYVASGTDSKQMFELDGTTLLWLHTYTLDYRCWGIAYDNSRDEYLIYDGNDVHICNSNFADKGSFAAPLDGIYFQNIGFHEDMIHVVYVYPGSGATAPMFPGGLMRVYDRAGQLMRTQLVTTEHGEIESLYPTGGGTFWANFADNGICTVRSVDLYVQTAFDVTDMDDVLYGRQHPAMLKTINFYVDSTYTGTRCDGTQARPFRDFTRLAKILKNYDNQVNIYARGTFGNVAIYGVRCSVSILNWPGDAGTINIGSFIAYWVTGNLKFTNVWFHSDVLYAGYYCGVIALFSNRLSFVGCSIDHYNPSGGTVATQVGVYLNSSNASFYDGTMTISNSRYAAYLVHGSRLSVLSTLTGTGNTARFYVSGSTVFGRAMYITGLNTTLDEYVNGGEINLRQGSKVVYLWADIGIPGKTSVIGTITAKFWDKYVDLRISAKIASNVADNTFVLFSLKNGWIDVLYLLGINTISWDPQQAYCQITTPTEIFPSNAVNDNFLGYKLFAWADSNGDCLVGRFYNTGGDTGGWNLADTRFLAGNHIDLEVIGATYT